MRVLRPPIIWARLCCVSTKLSPTRCCSILRPAIMGMFLLRLDQTLTHSLLQRTRQASWPEELMPYNREFADGGRKTNLGLGG